MKLRIRGNSVRLRLTKSEVAEFSKSGLVEEIVEFGLETSQQFVYALSLGDMENPTATFENNRLTVFIPTPLAEEWTQTEKVGIRAEQTIADNKTFNILIEKDFACMEERLGEDESDAFPNPLIDKVC